MTFFQRIRQEYDALVGKTNLPQELRDREHIYSAYSNAQSVDQGDESYEAYAKMYQYHTWVRKAVSVIARNITALPVRVVDSNDQAIDGHPLNAFLSGGNPSHPQADIWEQWLLSKCLTGEAFFAIEDGPGNWPLAWWHRRSDKIDIIARGDVDSALYPQVFGYQYDKREAVIPAASIWHDRFVDPLNEWRGLPVISAVRQGIIIDVFAQAWSKWFLKNNARPDFAVIAPEGVTKTEREEIRADLVRNNAGVNNHLPVVLEQGITDIKPLTFTPKDTEWLSQREFSRDEIAAMFGVPDEVMGYGRDTYENFDAAHKWFWRLTLKPMCDARDRSLTHHFTRVRPLLKPGQRIATDYSDVNELQEDLEPKVRIGKDLWTMGVPYNTLDEKLGIDMGKIEGGDVGYVPFSVIPAGQAADEPEPTPEPDNEPEPDEPEPDEQEQRSVRNKALDLEYGSQKHELLWQRYTKALNVHERRMQRQLKRDFQREQDAVLAALKDELGRAYLEGERKRLQEAIDKDVVDERFAVDVDRLIDWQTERETLAQTYKPLFWQTLLAFAEQVLEDLGIIEPFNETDPFAIAAAKSLPMQFAEDICETTQKRMAKVIREILLEAHDQGLSTEEIRAQVFERVSDVFNVRKSDYETMRIARTEMHKASNEGILQAGTQNAARYRLRKAWVAALDEATRQTHVEAHIRYVENPIGPNEVFEVGSDVMQAPGMGSDPAEIIHCRCNMVWVRE